MEWILIGAIGKQGEMGLQGRLPWNHPEDLSFFKKTTEGHPLVMGRKTFESLPGILKNRPHCVLTQSQWQHEDPRVQSFNNTEGLETWVRARGFEKIFVIGGRQIYQIMSPLCTEIILTHFDSSFEADTFFPFDVLKERPILEKKELHGPSLSKYRAHIIRYGALSKN